MAGPVWNLKEWMHSDPNIQLMLRLQQDDVDAFRLLFDCFRSRVYRQLYVTVQHREEAEDLTQDVFLRVFSHRKTYWPRARFATWLFRIVHNVGQNALRSRRRFRQRFVPMHESANNNAVHDRREPAPLPALLQLERRQQLRAALDKLTDHQRMVLKLYEVDGWSYAEIACWLKLTPQSVKGLLGRARAGLRRSLTAYWMRQEQ